MPFPSFETTKLSFLAACLDIIDVICLELNKEGDDNSMETKEEPENDETGSEETDEGQEKFKQPGEEPMQDDFVPVLNADAVKNEIDKKKGVTKEKLRHLKLKTYTTADLNKALVCIANKGLSYRLAAKKFGIPYQTLYRRLRMKQPLGDVPKGPAPQVPAKVEEKLVRFLLADPKRTVGEACEATKHALDLLGIKTSFTDNQPSKSWFTRFVKRHPEVKFASTTAREEDMDRLLDSPLPLEQTMSTGSKAKEQKTKPPADPWFLGPSQLLPKERQEKLEEDKAQNVSTEPSGFPRVKVLNVGYSRVTDVAAQTMHANCTVTFIKGCKFNILVDTMTAWDGAKLLALLEGIQVKPEDIDFVICTHGHSDHTGCNYLFTNAAHFLGQAVQRAEKFETTPLQNGNDYVIEPSVKVVSSPGHTMDSVTVLVETGPDAFGLVAVTGDLFEREEDIVCPELWRDVAGSENPKLQEQNRSKILQQADYVIPGHGPMFKNIYKKDL
ncbi:Hypothetical predicted protein [Cloeon dipterum]|uniref:Metallo-beta-lactamase domain-containing protein 1 n=1 Tax=Cloeon dipterum TaxID=197152 RepID=A0A8S1CJP0_9INSE|nr:Hypothetical predicted protein [Cloeon dipterum]